MKKTKMVQLSEFGQSVWLDYISRSLIDSGKLKMMIDMGLLGMTSNPTIFDRAISSSDDYDGPIQALRGRGKSTFEAYDEITVRDIQDAADAFLPVYEKTGHLDGYVSLEVDPKLAYNAKETIKEGNRLHKKVNRPNVMFKVPATNEGLKAIEELTASGINVNATLIFSLEQYVNTASAYIEGIKRLINSGGNAGQVHSVASVFVSRIDTVVDKILDEKISKETGHKTLAELISLKGSAAVANSALIYGKFREIFSSGQFSSLKSKRANIQRTLWGSTGTKNPVYSDIKYVTELIGKDTVNTIPENTLEAFLDHGKVEEVLIEDTSGARDIIESLSKFGIDVDEICAQLLKDGVGSFEKSFNSLLNAIEKKSEKLYVR